MGQVWHAVTNLLLSTIRDECYYCMDEENDKTNCITFPRPS
jgi:hypothetical protein